LPKADSKNKDARPTCRWY